MLKRTTTLEEHRIVESEGANRLPENNHPEGCDARRDDPGGEFHSGPRRFVLRFGGPGESATVSISEKTLADTPMALTLSVLAEHADPSSRIDALSLNRRSPSTSVPVAWRLKPRPAGEPRPPDAISHTGDMVSWLIDETSGGVEYEVEGTLLPEVPSAPGDYALEIRVDLAPVF